MQARSIINKICRTILLFAIVMTCIIIVKVLLGDNAITFHPCHKLQQEKKIEESPQKDNQSSLPGQYLSAFNVVDMSNLPPLPKLPADKFSQNVTIIITRTERKSSPPTRSILLSSVLFRNPLSEREVRMMANVTKAFHDVMTNASLIYFIYKGSLLGSYRHHGIIPWDDDLDVIVRLEDKEKVQEVFAKNCPPGYGLVYFNRRYKFFHESGEPLNTYRAPYLDISFYKENDTHLWDRHLPNQPPFLKSTVFPLRDRPFLGHMFRAPRDPLVNLQVTYKIDDCYSGYYSHVHFERKNLSDIWTAPCSSLINSAPFVNHVRGPGGAWCEEILVYRGQVLNTFIRSAEGIPVC